MLETTRLMWMEFQHMLAMVWEQYKNQLDVMHETVKTSSAEVESLQKQIVSLQDRIKASNRCFEQVASNAMEYCGAWLLADYRVKQLSSELLSLGHDIPEERTNEHKAQSPPFCPSPRQSSSRRLWKDSDLEGGGESDVKSEVL
jgi:hypothetical protein